MKIVFQHDHILPVIKYGGIERIIYWHMKELVKQGHHVYLIGHSQSQTSDIGVELIPMPDNSRANWEKLIPKDTDIVHLFYNYTTPLDFPIIVTIQGNGVIGEQFHRNTVFISKKHAQNHQSETFIYNGIDFSEYPYEYKDLGWKDFLFLAKGSWSVKNLKGCIRACKKNKKNLHIAGGKSWIPSRYIKNYGMVGGDEKISIIKKCDALLFPVRWHEPFGIAIIEAMAMGLPVIGSPYGSLPELISKDSGLIVNNQMELEEALRNTPKPFNSKTVHTYAKTKFNIELHTKSYLDLYPKVISGKFLNPSNPSWSGTKQAVELLPF